MKLSVKQLVAICLTILFAAAVTGCDAEAPDGGGPPPAQGPQKARALTAYLKLAARTYYVKPDPDRIRFFLSILYTTQWRTEANKKNFILKKLVKNENLAYNFR